MSDVATWLLEGDPSIRWQVLRDLTDAPPGEVSAARALVARTGHGSRLHDLYADGAWAGGACFPGADWRPPDGPVGDPQGQPWTATLPTLRLLRTFGVDPADPVVVHAVDGVREGCRWEYDGSAFFDGEVEPCINGGTVSVGAYFGQDVDGIVQRLLGEQLEDGGWNCEAENGSTRSSFNTTICVLEALLEVELVGGSSGHSPDVTAARLRGQEYLLERHLFRRLSTGEVIARDRKGDASWTRFAFPTWWHYDVLRGLDYLRRAGATPDERVAEAIALVESKRDADGRWPLETRYPGTMPVQMDEGEGQPSRWNTLRALRVLEWYAA
ncbi:MAG: hypothetical protein ACTHMZ_03975 [Actinomycetes bacterium]